MIKKVIFKTNLLTNIIFATVTVIFLIIALELVLGFTEYRYALSAQFKFPKNYFKQDNIVGFDIVGNFNPTIFNQNKNNSGYAICSNELGCFDQPYNKEKEYILLVGDSFTWGFYSFDQMYGTLLKKYLGYRLFKCGVPG